MTATVEIQLDLSRAAAVKRLFAKQSDIGARYIVATITDHQRPVEFDKKDSVYFRWEREGEEKSRELCQILTVGRVCVMLPAQALSEPSVLHCDFAVETEEVDSVTVSTEPFLLEVQQSAVNGSESDSVTGAVLVDQVVEDYSLGAVIRPSEGADGMRTAKVLSVQGLVDPSKDTVIPEVLVKGYTAHDAEGKPIVGELDVDAVRDEGYEAGKKSEYDAFWDAFQNYGKEIYYINAFGYCWNDNNFFPKYDFVIKGTSAMMMFHSSKITDLKHRLEECGVRIDTTELTYSGQMFQSSQITHIPELNISRSTETQYMFGSGCRVVTIDKLIVSETTFWRDNTFSQANWLENVTFEGVIAGNIFSVQWSTKLTHDSLISIINALKDYSQDTSGTDRVCTLGAENIAKLTDAEQEIARAKGWRLA
jgi:hypothetical protein